MAAATILTIALPALLVKTEHAPIDEFPARSVAIARTVTLASFPLPINVSVDASAALAMTMSIA
jgi:hypothetical protein